MIVTICITLYTYGVYEVFNRMAEIHFAEFTRYNFHFAYSVSEFLYDFFFNFNIVIIIKR